MNKERAAQLLRTMKDKKVLVIGDIMLDKFIWGSTDRISPEAPVAVVKVSKESFVPGGAANAANNLQSLGMDASIAGVVGKDNYGNILLRELQSRRIDVSSVVVDESRPTITKIRVFSKNHQMIRFDHEYKRLISEEIAKKLHSTITAKNWDAIVISDYDKGTNHHELFASLIQFARAQNIPIIVDPKVKDLKLYQKAFLVKPNEKEAYAMSGLPQSTPIVKVAQDLSEKLQSNILITRAEKGMLYCTRQKEIFEVPALQADVYDVTGAGDTVCAAITGAVCSGASPKEAMELGVAAAAVCISKVGTQSAFPEDVLNKF